MSSSSTDAGMKSSAVGVATQPKPDEILATKFKGTDVLGPDNQKVGDVTDVLFTKDGKVDAYIISVGGFLGVGSKDVAIAPNAVQWVPPDSNSNSSSYPKLKISMTKDQLKQAADFDSSKANRTTTGSSSSSSSSSSKMAPSSNSMAPSPAPKNDNAK